MSQTEDMAAIYDYMNRTKPVTPEATRMRSSFLAWYNALSWYSKSLDANTYNDARAKRTAFNKANKTPEIPGGLTTEQMAMEPSKRTDQIIEQQRTSERQQAIATEASSSTRKTIRRGSRGPDVEVWQRILNIKDDGIFGVGTETRTKGWQKAHGLTADGIVGPKTWSEAAADAKAKSEAAARKASELLQAPAPTPAADVAAPTPKPSTKKRAVRRKRPASVRRPTPKKAAQKKSPTDVVTAKTPPETMKAGYFDTLMALPTPVKVAGGVGVMGLALYFNEKYKDKGSF